MKSNVQPTRDMKFSYDWNGKLQCKFFTTIRLDSGYWIAGEYYNVWTPVKMFDPDGSGKMITKQQFSFRAKIHEVKSILLSQLPPMTAALDTGYSLAETRNIIIKMYPKKDWGTQRLAVSLVENIEWNP